DDSWGVSVARAQNDHQDNEWLVTASYGTPAQQMQVVLDSGSADGYVYSPACCYASNHSAFDPARSSSFNNRTLDGKTGRQVRAPAGTPGTEWNVTYGSGRGIQGYLGLDTVSFGSNLRIENMTFALATGATGGSSSGKMEGLIGFAPSRSLDPYYPGGWNDPLEEGVREGKLTKPYLTATLVEAERRTGLGGGGRYTFGSLDSAAARTEPTWLNATSSNYWGISYDSIRIGSTDVDDPADKYHRMIVDTGTALVLFSETITDKINAQIANSVKLQDEGGEEGAGSTSNPWLVPCRTGLPEYEARLSADKRNKPFSITLGGQEFTVPVSRFVFWPLEPRPTMNATVPFEDMCLSAFQPTSAPFAVLGDVFIRGHVVTFDTG
ncbi:acid protease, partial [Jaminaea rosea]